MADPSLIGIGFAICLRIQIIRKFVWLMQTITNSKNIAIEEVHNHLYKICQHKQKMESSHLSLTTGGLHLPRNQQWISEATQEKHKKIKQKRDGLKARLADEAPEGTPFDSIEVPLESEFKIMAENLGRKGRTICCLGSFPWMQKSTYSRAFCSGPSMDQCSEMQIQFNQIVGSVPTLQKENEKLRAELEAIKGSHGQSSVESSQQQH